MNILLSNATDIFAGGEDYVLILARYLAKRGHNVWVSANPGHLLLQKCGSAGIPTIPLSYVGMARVFSVARELWKELRHHAVDVVHSNANYDRTCAALAAAFLSTAHVAGVHSTHSIQHNITHYVRNRLGIDHFVVDADAITQVLLKEDSINASRITVVPIGVENESEAFNEEMRARTRKAWNVSRETIIVGNVARLVPFKGQKYLLRAIAEVVTQERNVLFPIIGDGELLGELQRLSRELEIDGYVRFLGFQDNLNELYPAFDVYCHSSLELAAEAFPLAILRALAAGLPVVCTNVGGIAAMVNDGVSGYLVQPGDPQVLADVLLRVIRDPALRRSMGGASFSLFLEQFHASAMAERIEEIYLRVLSHKTRVV